MAPESKDVHWFRNGFLARDGLGYRGYRGCIEGCFSKYVQGMVWGPLMESFWAAFGFAFSGWFGGVVRSDFGVRLGLNSARVLESGFEAP